MKTVAVLVMVLCVAGTAIAREAEKPVGLHMGPYVSALTSSGESDYDGGFGGGLKLAFIGEHFGAETSLSYLTGSDSAIESVSAWEFGVIGAMPGPRLTPYAVLGFGAYMPESIGDSDINQQSGLGLYLVAGCLVPIASSWELFGEVKYLSVSKDEDSLKSVHVDGDYNTSYYTPGGPAGFDFDGVGVNLGVLLRL